MAGGAPSLTQQALRAYFYVVLWMTVRCGGCVARPCAPGPSGGLCGVLVFRCLWV